MEAMSAANHTIGPSLGIEHLKSSAANGSGWPALTFDAIHLIHRRMPVRRRSRAGIPRLR
jgi:hypothetical protein